MLETSLQSLRSWEGKCKRGGVGESESRQPLSVLPPDFILADHPPQRVGCGLPDRPAIRLRSETDIAREVLVHIETDMTFQGTDGEQRRFALPRRPALPGAGQ